MSPDPTTPTAAGTEFRDPGQGAGPCRDTAMTQFLFLLWRWKLLIGGGSVLAALLVALLLRFWPPTYTATFVYEHPMTESEYNVLLRRFYSSENLARIGQQLRDKGLTRCAEELLDCETESSLEKLIRFTATPTYPKRLQTTDPATSEQISGLQAQLLSIGITGRSRPDVQAFADIVTGNFEQVLPMYTVRKDLKESIRRFKTMAADIEDNRFTLTIELQQEQSRLEKLKALDGPASDIGQDRVVLQFNDVLGSSEFLPLSYQIRAVQAKIIDLQETINTNKDRYNFCVSLLRLNDKLLAEVEGNILTHYTVQQFLDFLGRQLLANKEEMLSDYLKSYIRKTENLVPAGTRAGENPVIYPAPKYAIRRGGLALIMSLMLTTFVAVLLEYRHEGRGDVAGPRGPHG